MASQNDEAHWQETRKLMFIVVGLWIFFGFVIHAFVSTLNNIVILGFPLGFYMASQGSLIAFVLMIAWFARKQDQIDRNYGVAEDD